MTVLHLKVLMFVGTLFGGVPSVFGHGRLVLPPSRSSMWRFGYKTPVNYNDNELFCGGLSRQKRNGMRCGICGDPWDTPVPRPNELGGKYGVGVLSEKYKSGTMMNARVELTANHQGFFEFRVCPVNGDAALETEECLRQHPLEVVGEGRQPDRAPYQYVVPRPNTGMFDVKLRLPEDMFCSQCVFQWTYTAGNNWGTCENGTQAVGCGNQETFRGCADISIEKRDGESVPIPSASGPVVDPMPPVHKPFHPIYHNPNRRPNHSQIPRPHRRKPLPPPTYRPFYVPPSRSWDHWNSGNAWPNSVNPGYPHGKPSTTTWFYHQWPSTSSAPSRPHNWPSTPDLKTSPRPVFHPHNWAAHNNNHHHHHHHHHPHHIYSNRRPVFHPTSAHFPVNRLSFATIPTTPRPRFTPPTLRLPEQEEWPSTPDLKTSPRPHPSRKPHRKWNPEMDDFPNDVFSPDKQTTDVPLTTIEPFSISTATTTTTYRPWASTTTTTTNRPITTRKPRTTTTTTTRPTRPTETAEGCHAIGVYRNMPGMDGWCIDNCNHIPPFCPPSHCRCD